MNLNRPSSMLLQDRSEHQAQKGEKPERHLEELLLFDIKAFQTLFLSAFVPLRQLKAPLRRQRGTCSDIISITSPPASHLEWFSMLDYRQGLESCSSNIVITSRT